MKKIIFCVLTVILLFSCKKDKNEDVINNNTATEVSKAKEPKTLDYLVADKAGIKNWNEIKTVHFTFNVSKDDKQLSQRKWTWRPKSNMVILESNGETVKYNRSQKLDSLTLSTDRGFINDVYWLLPQFKTQWDDGAAVSFPDDKTIQLQYTGDGGYTPGDRYDFTVNKDLQVTSWDYYPAGADQPAMTTTFENYKTFNGITVAMDHKSLDGSLNIYFTDVAFLKN